jgi:hypothetical protein
MILNRMDAGGLLFPLLRMSLFRKNVPLTYMVLTEYPLVGL